MSKPNYKKSEEELNALPIEWERHESRDKWALLESPEGKTITYHMSARTYRYEGNQTTTPASVELMYKRAFLDELPDFLTFGPYEGHSIEWIVQEDPDYAKRLLEKARKEWLEKALRDNLRAAGEIRDDCVEESESVAGKLVLSSESDDVKQRFPSPSSILSQWFKNLLG